MYKVAKNEPVNIFLSTCRYIIVWFHCVSSVMSCVKRQSFSQKKGVYRHLAFYSSDSQSVMGDGKVTVRLFLVIIKPDVTDNEDARFYLPSPFWYEGQNACRNGKKYMVSRLAFYSDENHAQEYARMIFSGHYLSLISLRFRFPCLSH